MITVIDIILAILAGYIIIRLRNELGKKDHNDMPQPKSINRFDQELAKNEEVVQDIPEEPPVDETVYEEQLDDALQSVVDSITAKDSGFSVSSFLAGANTAFEMILEAFSSADKPTLKSLLDKNLYGKFEEELKSIKQQGVQLENTLISVLSSELVDAKFKSNIIELTVKFISEQINVKRDKDGEILEGDTTRINRVEDQWTFKTRYTLNQP